MWKTSDCRRFIISPNLSTEPTIDGFSSWVLTFQLSVLTAQPSNSALNLHRVRLTFQLSTPKFLIPERILLSLGPEAIRKEHLQQTSLMRSPKRQAYVDYIHEALQDISILYFENRFTGSEEKQIDRIEALINFEINLAKVRLNIDSPKK